MPRLSIASYVYSNNYEVLLILTSRLLIAHGLGRNIAVLKHFNHLTPFQLTKRGLRARSARVRKTPQPETQGVNGALPPKRHLPHCRRV